MRMITSTTPSNCAQLCHTALRNDRLTHRSSLCGVATTQAKLACFLSGLQVWMQRELTAINER